VRGYAAESLHDILSITNTDLNKIIELITRQGCTNNVLKWNI